MLNIELLIKRNVKKTISNYLSFKVFSLSFDVD